MDLRTIVAASLKICEDDGGYISHLPKTAEQSTVTKVQAFLQQTPLPELKAEYFGLADEIISFFTTLNKTLARTGGTLLDEMYQSSADAITTNITTDNFIVVVQMSHLYGRYWWSNERPRKPTLRRGKK